MVCGHHSQMGGLWHCFTHMDTHHSTWPWQILVHRRLQAWSACTSHHGHWFHPCTGNHILDLWLCLEAPLWNPENLRDFHHVKIPELLRWCVMPCWEILRPRPSTWHKLFKLVYSTPMYPQKDRTLKSCWEIFMCFLYFWGVPMRDGLQETQLIGSLDKRPETSPKTRFPNLDWRKRTGKAKS